MQRRTWLIGISSILGLCILSCIAIFFIFVPSLRDDIQIEVADAVGTEVSRQLPATPGQQLPPGEYTITQEALQASLRENVEGESVDDVVIRINTTGIEAGFTSRGREAIYTGTPAAENGRFVLQDVDTNSGFLGYLLPAGDFADAVETAINRYLDENALRLENIRLDTGEMVLVTSAT